MKIKRYKYYLSDELICKNKIGDVGAKDLSDDLKVFKSIKYLVLDLKYTYL